MIHATIETLITHIVPYHPRFSRFVSSYQGSSVCLKIGLYHQTFYIHQSGILPIAQEFPNATAEMNIEAVLASLGMKQKNKQVTFQGDHKLAAAFVQLFTFKHLEYETFLHHTLPSNTAVGLLEFMHLALRQKQYMMKTLREQLHHYLVFEKGLCASKDETEQLYEKIWELKWAVDKIKASIS